MTRSRASAGITVCASALVLLMQGCGDSPEERSGSLDLEPIPLPTAAPSASSLLPEEEPEGTAPAPEGVVLYEHDFSSPEGGMLAGQSSDAGTNEFGTRAASYSQGTLLVHVESHLGTYVAGASTEGVIGGELLDLRDVSIEADVTPLEIDAGASWGLSCRRERGVGSFYFAFLGDAGGHAGAGIIRQDQPGGEWTEIASDVLPEGVVIGEGLTNRLRLDCLGSTLTLFADGVKVIEGTDGSYATGSVALFANPLPDGEADVAFDNLVIREA